MPQLRRHRNRPGALLAMDLGRFWEQCDNARVYTNGDGTTFVVDQGFVLVTQFGSAFSRGGVVRIPIQSLEQLVEAIRRERGDYA